MHKKVSAAFGRITRLAAAHKILTSIAVIAVLFGGYRAYAAFVAGSIAPSYIVSAAETGTIIASITGTGQVSASNQLDVKPQVSGEIIALPVRVGDRVATGQVIARIDSTSAQKAVRDARANLESSQISLAKLQKAADELTLTQSRNSLENAQDDLAEAYADSYDDVVAVYLALPSIMTDFEDIVIGTSASRGSQWNIDYYRNSVQNWDNNALHYRDDAYASYLAATEAYAQGLAAYRTTSAVDSTDKMETTVNDAYARVQKIADALAAVNSFLRYYADQVDAHNQSPSTTANTGLTTLSTHISAVNSHLTALRSDVAAIKSGKQNISESQQSLQKIQSGTDPLDLQSAQLSVTKAQNSLNDALANLADYTVRAPFSGTIASLPAQLHSTAGGSAVATLITTSSIAEISLNEIDAAKVSVGNKASLTFDAVPDLIVAGTVSEVGPVGTVSQGVVTYTVKVSFDAQDTRVKPGMSVAASIITDTRSDVVIVPASAVKVGAQGGSYVLVFDPPLEDASGSSQGIETDRTPLEVEIVTGISSDTETEVMSGLSEGMQVVTRTMTTPQTGASAASAPSIFSAAGAGNRTTGGAARAVGR